MPEFRITAEHVKGKSVSHPCRKGVYCDPTEALDLNVIALTEDDAIRKGFRKLETLCECTPVCDCSRKLHAGSNAWYDSVTINVEQQ